MNKILHSLIFFLGFMSLNAMDVAKSPNDVNPLLVSSKIPSSQVQNINGQDINLANITKGKPTVVVFYRGGWCPYCNRQLSALGQLYPELEKMGFQILGISPDTPAELKKSLAKNKVHYSLISDSKMNAAKDFGIAFQLKENLINKYKTQYGHDLEQSSGQTHHQLPVPGIFIFNKDGILTFQYVNPDYKLRLGKDLLLAAAKDAIK